MTCRLLIAAIVACTTSALAACGSSGTHTQDFTPTSSSPTAPTSSVSTSPAPTTSTSGPSSSPKVKPVPTPSVATSAQGAVDAYIRLTNLANSASLDPAHADLSELRTYLTGNALKLYNENFAGMKTAGEAYRGTPADPRVKVQSVPSPTVVLLTSCPLSSATDPFTEYYVATGKALPVPTRTPPPPYLTVLTMVKTGSQWQLSGLVTNAGKTCTA